MPRFLKIRKPIWSLIAAQALCLMFGLWMHGQLFVSSLSFFDGEATSSTELQSPVDAEGEPLVQPATIRQTIVPVAGIAFFWTLALQAGVAFLILSRLHSEHSRDQMKSNEKSLQTTKDLLRTRDAVIFGLARLAESRDPDTGHHLERIALYSARMVDAMRRSPKHRRKISDPLVRLIGISSALHDIGKVAVEDRILLKPGPLTSEERKRMHRHTTVGANIIRDIDVRLGDSSFLDMAREIALGHHERWDGTGYPAGLSGEEIPLAARIVSIADVYDALSSRRVYKEAYPHKKCVAVIREGAGTQFDPELVEVFSEIESEFREIAERYPETMATATAEDLIPNREPEHLLTPDQEQVLLEMAEPTVSVPMRPAVG